MANAAVPDRKLPEFDTYGNGYGRSRWRFERETAHHRMTVLHDDGLYRHLRFQDPETWAYGFDLVTWPGYLSIGGDVQQYVFSRTRDMFEFFEGSSDTINPSYWAQKLQAPQGTRGAERFEHESFCRRVNEWLKQTIEDQELDEVDAGSLKAAVQDRLLDPFNDHTDNETLSIGALMDFEHNGITISEPYEWSIRDWDWSFLWCCWAIVHGIAAYRLGEFR